MLRWEGNTRPPLRPSLFYAAKGRLTEFSTQTTTAQETGNETSAPRFVKLPVCLLVLSGVPVVLIVLQQVTHLLELVDLALLLIHEESCPCHSRIALRRWLIRGRSSRRMVRVCIVVHVVLMSPGCTRTPRVPVLSSRLHGISVLRTSSHGRVDMEMQARTPHDDFALRPQQALPSRGRFRTHSS